MSVATDQLSGVALGGSGIAQLTQAPSSPPPSSAGSSVPIWGVVAGSAVLVTAATGVYLLNRSYNVERTARQEKREAAKKERAERKAREKESQKRAAEEAAKLREEVAKAKAAQLAKMKADMEAREASMKAAREAREKERAERAAAEAKAKEERAAAAAAKATAAAAAKAAREAEREAAGEEAEEDGPLPPLEDAPGAGGEDQEKVEVEDVTEEDSAVTPTTSARSSEKECSLETLLQVFSFTVVGLKATVAELQAMQMQYGHTMPEEMLSAAMSNHYRESVVQLQEMAYKRFDVTEPMLEAAAVTHADNKRFKALLKEMDNITQLIMYGQTPEPDASDLARLPAGFGAKECAAVLDEISGHMVTLMEEVLVEVKAREAPRQPTQLMVAERHTERIEAIRNEVWAKHGLDEASFTAAVLLHQADPTLVNAHERLQQEQQKAVLMVQNEDGLTPGGGQ